MTLHTITIFLSFILLALVAESRAAELSGTQEPSFKKAVDLWLDGNDRDSLPQLARLARDGNPAARLLLARIERKDRAPSAYIDGLTTKARLDLFRAPKHEGLFRKTWLQVEAANGNPLAQALQRANGPEVDLDLIRDLRAAGEFQATDHPLRIAALYGGPSEHDALLDEALILPELVPYVSYNRGPPEPRGDGLAALRMMAGPDDSGDITPSDPDSLGMAALLALGFGFGDLSPGNRWRPTVESWLLNNPATRPMAELCRQACPTAVDDGPGRCAIAAMALTGGYYEIIRLDSPLESVIPQADFLASERARTMTLRQAATTLAETGAELASIDEIAAHSPCMAKLVAGEREGF
ncbi:MAG: hypothetical protein AAF530_25780 [Pseudomonadota bacterium]